MIEDEALQDRRRGREGTILKTNTNKRGHKVPGNTKDQIRKIKNKKKTY